MNIKKITIIIIAAIMTTLFLIVALQQQESFLTHAFQIGVDIEPYEDEEYINYLSQNTMHRPNLEIEVDHSYIDMSSTGVTVIDGLTYQKPHELILTDESAQLKFEFFVPEAGYYNLEMTYFPIEGKSSRIERRLLINGVMPIRAASRLTFERVWKNERETFLKDRNGNDIIPRQIESPKWLTEVISDSDGLIPGHLLFYFNEGANTLNLQSLKEPLLIENIKLIQSDDAPTYETYWSTHASKPDLLNGDEMIIIQGQDIYEKSSPTLYPLADRTSPITSPQSSYQLLANIGGGYNWRVVGDWLTYKFDIETPGFYQISVRAKQSYIRGAYVSRALKIDGEVPFKEVSNIPFVYSGNFTLYEFGKEDVYEFYLDEGPHELSLEVVLGDFNAPIREVSEVINDLNKAYRDIIMITTAQPDIYRDYQLTSRLPDLLSSFRRTKETLERISQDFYTMTNESSQHTVILDKVALQLEAFLEKPETIHRRLAEYQNNISALGTWILEIKEQPLAIDYIAIHSPAVKIDRFEASIFQNIWFGINNFIASFVVDYNSLSSVSDLNDTQGSVTVWIGSGRDQANILRRMIDEEFTSVHNIGVNLQLVSMDVLLPSTLTNKGPDVAIGVGNQIPVNYAMRNAVYDISQFDDFNTVSNRFQTSAFEPFYYQGGYYALPDTQQFPVMFYRKDILDELNIEIPETWEDVISIIPELQRVNLDFYLPIDIVEAVQGILPPNVMFTTLLYQNGGQLYMNEGRESGLSERVALDAFKQWSDFYTNYRFQIQANFVNRFRSGEMPIGIAYYSMYNTLSVFAPEISGQWGFTNVPGVRQADDSINNIVPTTGTGIILLNQSKNKELAWTFMKWWTSENTQVRFGREMEGILGAAARYPTANVSALSQLPWPSEDLLVLQSQWANTFGIPEVPGGYFTGRHIDNALRRVINTGANPRDTLYEYTIIINNEIRTKRKEFDLD